MMKDKKAISEVVTTVLLVFLAVIAVGLIAAFVVPMIREGLSGGESCFKLKDYGKILSSANTCSNDSETRLMIERGMENYSIKGFAVSILTADGSTKYDIINGATEFSMKGSASVEIPEPGEAKIYIFSEASAKNAEKATLAVIPAKGEPCSIGTFDIPSCGVS